MGALCCRLTAPMVPDLRFDLLVKHCQVALPVLIAYLFVLGHVADMYGGVPNGSLRDTQYTTRIIQCNSAFLLHEKICQKGACSDDAAG
jgi:hypothetical protein